MKKSEFKKIFDEAMSDTVYNDGYSKFDVEPRIVIRDFFIESYPECDTEFKDFEEAWEYFDTLSMYRVMSATGSIYLDSYDKEVSR